MSNNLSSWRLALCLLLAACGGSGEEPLAVTSPVSFDRSSNAYRNPVPLLTVYEMEKHAAGDGDFEAKFVPGNAAVFGGLGPLFNNVSCASCHIRDGRGMPVIGDDFLASSLLVRVSMPGEPSPDGPMAIPGIGLQIQDQAAFGHAPEAKVTVEWQEFEQKLSDGTSVAMRQPKLDILFGNTQSEFATSLRQPPPVFGMGLLEAIDEADIMALADPDDADGDGISGRPNMVWDLTQMRTMLGRFGHKANTATVYQQTAMAFAEDMGIGNELVNTEVVDIKPENTAGVTFYTQTLAPPAAVKLDALAQRGADRFEEFGCASCHTPSFVTSSSVETMASFSLAEQAIEPYTDLLLHDMGPGLADGRADFLATGSEWRTAPLWGIGLVQTVAPGAGYLHDGRARTLEEAILWHDGEAAAARQAFIDATADVRQELLQFLQSL